MNKIGMTQQYFYTIPTSCGISPTMPCAYYLSAQMECLIYGKLWSEQYLFCSACCCACACCCAYSVICTQTLLNFYQLSSYLINWAIPTYGVLPHFILHWFYCRTIILTILGLPFLFSLPMQLDYKGIGHHTA